MSSTSNTSSYSSLSTALNKGYLDSQNPRCFCGQTIVLMTAYKEENSGRRFYACHYFTSSFLRQTLIQEKDINSHNGIEKQGLWTTITDLRTTIDVLQSNVLELNDEINSWKLKHETLKLGFVQTRGKWDMGANFEEQSTN
ncbi:hypothetical protein ACFE04_005811 [Oxalis oulophora]